MPTCVSNSKLGAYLNATVATPLGLNANVSGSLDFSTGAFVLTGNVGYSIDLKIFNPSVNLQVTLSNYGAQGMDCISQVVSPRCTMIH